MPGTPPGPAVGLTDDYNAGHTMWFDDRASEPISKCCQSPDGGIFNGFMDGRYRPVDSLGRCAMFDVIVTCAVACILLSGRSQIPWASREWSLATVAVRSFRQRRQCLADLMGCQDSHGTLQAPLSMDKVNANQHAALSTVRCCHHSR
jgi:hypothetical protein